MGTVGEPIDNQRKRCERSLDMLRDLARIHLEIDGSRWANEARAGLLATFDHPTPLSLAFPLAKGGFGDVEDPKIYLQMAAWLVRLGLGYGLALTYLAKVLGSEGDISSISSRVAVVFGRVETTRT